MRPDLYALLNEAQRATLRAYHAHSSIAEAAHSLELAESTVNHRLAECRNLLGAHNSRRAAQWMAAHEQGLGTQPAATGSFSPGSFSPIVPHPASPPVVADTAIGEDDAIEHPAEKLWRKPVPPSLRGDRFPWPFPTAGREVNSIGWRTRLAMVIPTAAVLLLAMMAFTMLIVGFQDMLVEIQHLIAQLT